MELLPNIFRQFSLVSKEDWINKITTDLKGRPLAELHWQLEENIKLSPAYTAEDISGTPAPLTAQKTANSWQIGAYIPVDDMGQANATVLEELNGGINAPLFKLRHLPSLAELDILLNTVNPTYISIHFALQHPGKDPAEFFRNLVYYARKHQLDLATINGSVDFDPLLDWANPPFQALARILRFASLHTPNFKVVQVNALEFHAGAENSSRELALTIAKGIEYLDQLERLDIPPVVTNQQLKFAVANSCSYFVEIAKIRALKILWANVLSEYGLEEAPLPPISAHAARETQTDKQESNMIRATTQAMSAAIGGASTIYLRPANQSISEVATPFTRRIARNVQHLLQLESKLDQVNDPAAGSYYIEHLTRQLCESAWTQFKEIEQKGGYLNFVS